MKVCFIGCLVGFLTHCNAQEFVPWSYGNLIGNSYEADDYGCGVSVADIDLDGIDDFTLIHAYGPCKAYIIGEDSIQILNLPYSSQDEVRQVSWVDFDNDGDRDLCLTGRNMAAKLYRNSSMTFQDVSEELGLNTEQHSYYGHAWADYDRDGDLDLFVANYDQAYAGLTNFHNCLYRQDSAGYFQEVSAELGLVTEVNYSFMGLWTDINNDLWPDLFIINDRNESPNNMFLNNGDGSFTEISVSANLNDMILAMSATQGDYNNDGLLDYYITNNPTGNLHKLNLGNNTFQDVSDMVGTQLNLFSWSAQSTDFDCDGLEDLHICVSPHINYPNQNQILKNVGDFFIPYTEPSGMIPDNGWSRGSAVGDLNGDGFQDIIVSKSHPSTSKFWLSVPNENHWLKVSLRGVDSPKEGIGSWITCHKGNQFFSRYTNCGESYLAQNSYNEHFGLGEIELLDSIVVRWTSGQRDVWRRVPTNQSLILTEGFSAHAIVQATTPTPECTEMTQGFTALIPNGEIIWTNGDTSINTVVNANEFASFVWTDNLGNVFYSDTAVAIIDESELSVALNQPTCEIGSMGSANLIFNDTIWTLPVILNDSLISADYLHSLSSGGYSAQIVSGNGCQYSVNFSIESPPKPIDQITWETNDVSCNGSNDGGVLFSFNSKDTVDWAFIGDAFQPDSLSANHYSILVWNSSCYDTLSIEIFQPEELMMTMDIGPDAVTGNYIINLAASGGTAPYHFTIDQIEIEGTSISNVTPGLHLVQAMDDQQCIKDSIIYLDLPVSSLNEYITLQNHQLVMHKTGKLIVYDCSGRIMGFYDCEQGGCRYNIDLPAGVFFIADSDNRRKPLPFVVVRE